MVRPPRGRTSLFDWLGACMPPSFRELSRNIIENRKWSEEMPKLISENTRLKDTQTRQSLVDLKEGQWIIGEHESLNDAVARLAQASVRYGQCPPPPPKGAQRLVGSVCAAE